MTRRHRIPIRAFPCAAMLALAGFVCGCDDAAKKGALKAQVPPQSTMSAARQEQEPVSQPPRTTAAAKNPPKKFGLAPLPAFPPGRLLALLPPQVGRSSKDDLVARVQQKFAS